MMFFFIQDPKYLTPPARKCITAFRTRPCPALLPQTNQRRIPPAMASAMALRAVARLGMRHGGVLPLAASRGEAMPCVGHLARVLQQPSLGGLGCLTSCLYSTYPPHTVLEMPSLSPTMSQGNIASWTKAVGDSVSAGDVIAEIETDKATIEWESVDDGFMARILMPEGSSDLPVGTPVAVLCEEEEDLGSFETFSAADAATGGGG